ncbi:flavodoxin domain-containing protein [Rubrivirga sp. IMCC43871]|uniref:flavodoxin domain-containing protein n=1 Tax=Rubrivirga sp. IMCC43871 TaxID=3391575 RepID=UPI00398FD6AE
MLNLEAADPDVLVLVGTQTGNSERVADAVADALGDLGFAVHLLDMAEAYPEALEEYRQILAVVCTWSEGTFPDNAVDFAEALEAVRPDLTGAGFSVCGLGDRDYDPFYQTAAFKLIDLLATSGAREIVPLHDIDGGPSAEDIAGAVGWAQRCAAAWGEVAQDA